MSQHCPVDALEGGKAIANAKRKPIHRPREHGGKTRFLSVKDFPPKNKCDCSAGR